MNNTYKITVKSPLLRPGIEIETEVSGQYIVHALEKIMGEVRCYNRNQTEEDE